MLNKIIFILMFRLNLKKRGVSKELQRHNAYEMFVLLNA